MLSTSCCVPQVIESRQPARCQVSSCFSKSTPLTPWALKIWNFNFTLYSQLLEHIWGVFFTRSSYKNMPAFLFKALLATSNWHLAWTIAVINNRDCKLLCIWKRSKFIYSIQFLTGSNSERILLCFIQTSVLMFSNTSGISAYAEISVQLMC